MALTAACGASAAARPVRNGPIALPSDHSDAELYAVDLASGRTRALTRNLVDDAAPAFSPDGRRLAFASDREDAAGGVYVARADGTGARRIASGAYAPAWSPNGRTVAFLDERGNIAAVDVGGAERHVLVAARSGALGAFAWSPDGRELVYGADEGLVVGAVDGSTPARRLSDGDFESDPAWSPDGTTIAFRSRDGLTLVAAADGSARRVLARDGSQPAWSPDGRLIAFVGREGIDVIGSDGRGRRRIPVEPGLCRRPLVVGTPAWAPTDGRSSSTPPTSRPRSSRSATSSRSIRTARASGC